MDVNAERYFRKSININYFCDHFPVKETKQKTVLSQKHLQNKTKQNKTLKSSFSFHVSKRIHIQLFFSSSLNQIPLFSIHTMRFFFKLKSEYKICEKKKFNMNSQLFCACSFTKIQIGTCITCIT